MKLLIEEAAALKHVSRKLIISQIPGGEDTDDNDVIISILADLLEVEVLEGYRWFRDAVKVRSYHIHKTYSLNCTSIGNKKTHAHFSAIKSV